MRVGSGGASGGQAGAGTNSRSKSAEASLKRISRARPPTACPASRAASAPSAPRVASRAAPARRLARSEDPPGARKAATEKHTPAPRGSAWHAHRRVGACEPAEPLLHDRAARVEQLTAVARLARAEAPVLRRGVHRGDAERLVLPHRPRLQRRVCAVCHGLRSPRCIRPYLRPSDRRRPAAPRFREAPYAPRAC